MPAETDREIIFKIQESLRSIENRNNDRIYAVTLAHMIGLGAIISFLSQHEPFSRHIWAIVFVTTALSIVACLYVAALTSQQWSHFCMQAYALNTLMKSGSLEDLRNSFLRDDNVWGLGNAEKGESVSDTKHAPRRRIRVKDTLLLHVNNVRHARGDIHLLSNLIIGIWTNVLIVAVGLSICPGSIQVSDRTAQISPAQPSCSPIQLTLTTSR